MNYEVSQNFPKLAIKKKKSVPKKIPSLPVSLPLSCYHTYLDKTKYEKEKSKVIIKQIETPKSETVNIQSSPIESSTQTDINGLFIQSNKASCDTQTDVSESPLYSQLHLYIVQNSAQDKIYENKDCEPVTLKSHTMNTLIEKTESSTQTHAISICENEKEILRIIKEYDISKDNIEILHQDKLNNNDYQGNQTNLNIIEIEDSDTEIKENNQQEKELTLPDKYNYQPKSVITGSGNFNILMYSNLNKLVFKCLYKSINLKSQKPNDKLSINKELSQIGQKLVDDVFELIQESNVKHRIILDVIDLIEESEEVSRKTREEIKNTDCEILPQKRRATDEPLDLQINTSKQAKINETISQLHETQIVPLQTSSEQIVPTLTSQELPQRAAIIENFQPAQSYPHVLETGTMLHPQNRPENREIPQLYQAHRAQSMPNVNPVGLPHELYGNGPRLPYYYNPVRPYQKPPENYYNIPPTENYYISNQRPMDIGKQLPTTPQNPRELQKRLNYIKAFNFLNRTHNTSNNVPQFPQNPTCMRSNNMRFENLLEEQRMQLQQTALNYQRFPCPYKKNVRY